ncbi:MAG TPA: PIG-L family deacetylase [Pyrinomonadaceae bacterium]|nr:PIG-L family deacetylase [Pyrinomonadaceae bacterium]
MNKGTKRSAHADLFGSRELARQTRCVVIVAHPDDDIVGAGGLISRLEDVTVLHVTDGVAKDDHTSDVMDSESARARRLESRTALALANVPPEQIVEFGLSTEQAPFELAELTRRIAAFIKQNTPDVVLTNPYEGGDPDHDATAFATHAALRLLRENGFKAPSVFEIALYPTPDGNKRVLDFLPSEAAEITTLLLDKNARDLKQRMFACFTSQPNLHRENSFGRERFRRPPRYNFAAPPNGGKLNYKRAAAGVDWVEWQELVREAWSELFPDDQKSH